MVLSGEKHEVTAISKSQEANLLASGYAMVFFDNILAITIAYCSALIYNSAFDGLANPNGFWKVLNLLSL